MYLEQSSLLLQGPESLKSEAAKNLFKIFLKIIDNQFGLEGTSEIISFKCPAMGQHTLHQTRLLSASSPALNTSRDGALTAPCRTLRCQNWHSGDITCCSCLIRTLCAEQN